MIKAPKLAIAIAIIGPLTVATPVLSAAGDLKEHASATSTVLKHRTSVVRQYWDYVPNRRYPFYNSYYNESYWKGVGPATPDRDPYVGTIWDGVAPY
jgi:hypothetical protein